MNTGELIAIADHRENPSWPWRDEGLSLVLHKSSVWVVMTDNAMRLLKRGPHASA